MKKVKSLQELQRAALARGAAVTVGQQHFNTTRDKVDTKKLEGPAEATEKPQAKPPEKAPEKAPDPAPVAPPTTAQTEQQLVLHLDMEPIARSMDSTGQMVAQKVAEALRTIQPDPAAKPHGWVFEIKRDLHGRLDKVIATPSC